MSEKDATTFERDEKGNIIAIKNPHGIPESAVLIPFLDSVRRAVKDLDENTNKYSRRMEKLTIALIFLTFSLIFETGILIVLGFIH
jgi:hypothetical protein